MSDNFPHVTHHFQRNPDNGTYHVSKVTPIVRLSCNGSTLYLQRGQVFDEGGNVVKDLPAWFYDEVGKCTDRALVECGFHKRPTRPGESSQPTGVGKAVVDAVRAAKSEKSAEKVEPTAANPSE